MGILQERVTLSSPQTVLMAVEIEELQEECTGITLGGTASYLARYLVLSVNSRLIQADRG